ncbi:hypothetical protein [Sulfurovum sp.]|uniref:hypothetical protein n=1 Tax=Sulfurovum sp. TaxID=1969726 RepID=UPI0025FAD332|nr:hypothetical protein [Sulfurovum sp.]
MWNSTIKSFVLVLLLGMPIISGAAEINDNASNTKEVLKKRVPVKIEGKKLLPLRVLARPFSNIYADKSLESPIVQSNVPAMQPFYVYTRPTAEDRELEAGWYEVGSNSQGKVLGWMQSKDVFEWKQTMCLAYTHPEGRKPVLMFDSKSTLNKLIKLPGEERVKDVDGIYTAIDEHNISQNFPVKSVEPKRAVDIQKEFYLLPILDFEAVDFGNREARVVKLTAVTNARAGARDESDIRKSEDYLVDAVTPSTVITKKKLKKLNIDIVWVFDTTVSMRPFIKDTLDVVREVSVRMADNHPDNIKLNFGIWGYRDSVEDIPRIGYTTKNYTPELIGIKDFTKVLEKVKVTPVDSVDYPEDMFSGISDAMEKTAWSPNAMKLIILVGDAPSHKVGHKWNLSGQNEETLRSIADDNKIYIAAFHLQNPKAEKFRELAETQYRTLATNPGSKEGNSAFEEVSTTNKEAFKKSANDLTDAFVKNFQELLHVTEKEKTETKPTPQRGGELAFSNDNELVDIDKIIPKDNNASVSRTTNMANRMFRAAMVEWIGSQTGAEAPRDVVAWAIDKDLEDSEIPSMEVRVLLNKRQLDSLATVLQSIIRAGFTGQIAGEDFFTSLQAATATIARDPNMVKQAKRMADTGLIPEFLEGLPYQSQLMAITNELWSSWSADEQNEFINTLDAKVEAYKKIHNTPEGWIALNKGDDLDEYVYPISLDLLP